jgi:integrase/recombinase XerD
MNKKTKRAESESRPTGPAQGRAALGDAGSNGGQVTLAQALALLFEHDLHPATGTSRHTIDSYKTTFRLLLRFVEQNRPELLPSTSPVERFDASLVESFLRHLQTDRRCQGGTINVRRAAFGALARSLGRRYPHLTPYCHSLLAIRSRKTQHVLIGYFEVHELEAIFEAVDTSTPDGFRDLVMLRFLYNTGARASELCGLRRSDLRLCEPPHVLLHGKGGKSRTVPLWPVTADLLRAYLKGARRIPKPGHQELVFIGRRGNALTRQGLYKIARRHLEAAARKLPHLARPELHPVCSLRHTTATHLYMAGVSLPEIQDLLGHERPETTMRYRTVNLERKRHALRRLLDLRSQPPPQTASKTLPETADHQQLLDWLERL